MVIGVNGEDGVNVPKHVALDIVPGLELAIILCAKIIAYLMGLEIRKTSIATINLAKARSFYLYSKEGQLQKRRVQAALDAGGFVRNLERDSIRIVRLAHLCLG